MATVIRSGKLLIFVQNWRNELLDMPVRISVLGSLKFTDDGSALPHGIPVVVVLVDGGVDSITFASESIKCKIPMVVRFYYDDSQLKFRHSGMREHWSSSRYFCVRMRQHYWRWDSSSLRWNKGRTPPTNAQCLSEPWWSLAYGESVREPFMFYWICWLFKIVLLFSALIDECIADSNLIHVFDIDQDKEFDLAILSAILQCESVSDGILNKSHICSSRRPPNWSVEIGHEMESIWRSCR